MSDTTPSYHCPFCDWIMPAEKDHPTQVCIDRVRDQRTRGWRRAEQMEAAMNEARQIATHLMKHSVDCHSYQAELIEAYPWMREPAAASSAAPGVEK